MTNPYLPLPISYFKAQLPQNPTTAELQAYLSDYFNVVLPSWVLPNLIVVTLLMIGLVLAAVVVAYLKIRAKQFWFFRIQATETGNLLVVSPTSSFVIIEGFYAIGLLIMSWCMIARSSGDLSSVNFGFSSLILGVPLLAGAWNGIWGLFLSCPLGIGSKVKAKVLNTLFFLIPSIFIALTIVFTCLQGFSQRHATHLFEKLYADLKLQDPNSSPSINQLDQAAYVFQQGAFAWHRMSQGYTYFFVFAISMTIALTGVGFYLRKVLQHHLRYNAELLTNDESAIERSIWETPAFYFPRVKQPDTAVSTPLRGRTRRVVLHSALRLVQSLSASVAVSALMFSAVTSYMAFTLYPAAVKGPVELGRIIGVLIVFFLWITVAAAFPCFFLITSNLFEPALLGWQSRRAAGTNVVIKSPNFNDSVPKFQPFEVSNESDPNVSSFIHRRGDETNFESDVNPIEDDRESEGYRMKKLSKSSDGRIRNQSLTSKNADSFIDDSDQVTASIQVDHTYTETNNLSSSPQTRRDSDVRPVGSWRRG